MTIETRKNITKRVFVIFGKNIFKVNVIYEYLFLFIKIHSLFMSMLNFLLNESDFGLNKKYFNLFLTTNQKKKSQKNI